VLLLCIILEEVTIMESIKEIEVRYNETDMMGIVYHSNYVVWCELGRTKFFHDLGFTLSECEEKGIIFPVHEVQVKYKRPTKYGEKIYVKTKVRKFSQVKTEYEHIVVNDHGEIKVEAITSIVCVDALTFKPVRIKSKMPEVWEAYKKIS
jgi:acyl-CoA thioester hydrolase